ncbi:hypothetical protein [Vreelandella jeotgali]|uniref:hypothetical protein n=1 Tax=Vreelandella jeotgali TaxID=553386 RepID=UPI0012EA0267|nr:hypothetical protein [Halomonas jeotgali]
MGSRFIRHAASRLGSGHAAAHTGWLRRGGVIPVLPLFIPFDPSFYHNSGPENDLIKLTEWSRIKNPRHHLQWSNAIAAAITITVIVSKTKTKTIGADHD